MDDKDHIESQIKDNININADDIAFIIGNGIHRYADSLNDTTNECMSWDQLLINLSNGLYKNIPPGISKTEFFDIIELNKWKRFKEENQNETKEIIKNLIVNKKLLLLNKQIDINPIIQSASQFNKQLDINSTIQSASQLKSKQDLLNLNSRQSSILKQLDSPMMKLAQLELKKFIHKRLSKYGITNISDIPEFETFLLPQVIESDCFLKYSLACDTKKDIKSMMANWKSNPVVDNIVYQIKKLQAPLLTTNYDKMFSNSVQASFHKMNFINDASYKFSDFYPWNCYYGEDLDLPTSGFGIWHINGMIRYHRSISLGLADYMRCVSKAHKMLQGSSIFECDTFSGKNRNNWEGSNTWLHVFFNKSLFIFGLALDEDETFLRWFLIQRAKYFSSYGKMHKGWYIAKDRIDEGKKMFLEAVGFEIIVIEDYKTIYEDIWQ